MTALPVGFISDWNRGRDRRTTRDKGRGPVLRVLYSDSDSGHMPDANLA